jgi:predicted CoA-binding protein
VKSKKMLDLQKWAVVGATKKKDKFGYKMFRSLLDNGNIVYPVSPKYDEIDGVKTYKSIKDIPGDIDVVGFIVNPTVGLELIQDVIDLGIKNIWMQPGTRDPKIVKIATDNDINIVFSCVMVELGV